jgi:hypothetical protein
MARRVSIEILANNRSEAGIQVERACSRGLEQRWRLLTLARDQHTAPLYLDRSSFYAAPT